MMTQNGILCGMDITNLPKAYDASSVEDEIYAAWEASGFFNPDKLPKRNQKGEPYCIVMPPPNRTGTLHMGHAVMLAIQDLLIRFERMRGKKTLWIPGTDHAAIATQVKVEQMLMKEGIKNPREELGREKFLEKVVAFAEESSKTINKQVRKMGSSCDWSRERYTLDEARSRAVNEVFRMMYEDGLIEQGARIVNWDPNTQTVVSDDEVTWVEEKAPFFEFQYGPFVIGTSRPETKFGDKYVVMHPDDSRYKKYKQGEKLTVEWINGPIEATIIKDEAVDREFGTGVMTMTPWHDMTDFEIAERHGLQKEQVIDLHGNLLPIAGEFEGMHIKQARSNVVEKLKKKGLLVNINENYIHRIATCSRGGGMIEPQILKQWFIRVTKPFALRQNTLGKWKKGDQVTLKELMREAVTSKQVKIIPERFEKIYFHWIDNLRDWCISRQIWFGHRIPVWYRGEEMKVAVESPGKDWQQDPDTLDTWFSSGLWTFSTLGWPDKKEWSALRQYHPTALLETGYDILFFWVARMVLMTTYALGEVPFKDVYLHGLVRDEQGRKMSKSLGNILDPLDLIPKYGTDAVRLSLLMGSTPGQDTRLSEAKIEGFRNFTNKLWNISRFILMQISVSEHSFDKRPMPRTTADHWIASRLDTVIHSVTQKLQDYQFSSAGEELRDFTWGDLADWYLEIGKVEKEKEDMLFTIFHTLIRLWHPFMPFVTEHIWQTAQLSGLLIIASWPDENEVVVWEDFQAKQFERLREFITDLRRLRAEQKIEPATSVNFQIIGDDDLQMLIEQNQTWISRLASATSIEFVTSIPTDWVTTSSGAWTIGFNPATSVDPEKERGKIKKELEETTSYIKSLEQKLKNKEFIKKAPSHIVEDMKHKLHEAQEKVRRLTTIITI